MADQANLVLKALNAFASGYNFDIVLALAGIGTIAMAVLQILKELSPLRRSYQKLWIKNWICRKKVAFENDKLKFKIDEKVKLYPNLHIDENEAEKLLVEFVTGGDTNACFELPIEELIAQLQDAKIDSINYPHSCLSFFLVISQGSSIKDVSDLLAYASSRLSAPSTPIPIEQRERVVHRMHRNLRGLEISLGQKWRWWMQLTSIFITTIIVEYIVWSYTNRSIHTMTSYTPMLMALPLAIVSGYIAPITRDLVAAMEKLRFPR